VAVVLRLGSWQATTAERRSPADTADARAEHLLPRRELVRDSRPLLAAAGFAVEGCEMLERWPTQAVALYQGILDHREAVSAEIGELARDVIAEAEWGTENAQPSRRFMAVAVRRRAEDLSG
jgi:hypothetical protein